MAGISIGTGLGCRVTRSLGGASIGAVITGETLVSTTSLAAAVFTTGGGAGGAGVSTMAAATFVRGVPPVRTRARARLMIGVAAGFLGGLAAAALFLASGRGAAAVFLTVPLAERADFRGADFCLDETAFGFSIGAGEFFFDLPIFIGGPCNLRLQRAKTIHDGNTRPTKTLSGDSLKILRREEMVEP